MARQSSRSMQSMRPATRRIRAAIIELGRLLGSRQRAHSTPRQEAFSHNEMAWELHRE
jgi:Fic family protein